MIYEEFVFKASEEVIETRLDQALLILGLELSRSQIQTLIKDKLVLVNGIEAKASLKLKENDTINIKIPQTKEITIKPTKIDLNIVYEDEELLVVNKEVGMVVHPAFGHYEDTLVNALLYHFKTLSTINGEYRPGIVHRLDKDTSGLLIVAKNDKSHKILAEQFKDNSVYRRYVVLVKGELPHKEGTIKAPIGRSKNDRKKMAVVDEGKMAITHFKVLERFSGYTFLECFLETGRTHQIRVHLKYINFPVVGDQIYGYKTKDIDYQLLHAATLKFKHPMTGEEIMVNVNIPKHFEEVLNNLRLKGTIKGG